jgi:hypothetical protein
MFSPITLSEMDEVRLMNRMDTKFVVNLNLIPEVLQSVVNDYRILEISNNRLMTYDSKYYDTENLSFYLNHHNKRANRIKIRKRNYVESGITFLEIKRKDNKGITHKSRIPIDNFSTQLSKEGQEFITETVRKELDISLSISNRFNRITLVSKHDVERVTMDFNLGFDGNVLNENLAIIELKQEKLDRTSKLFQALKQRQIHPYSISKYCIGMATTQPNLKQNYFKHKILTINKKTA